MTPARCHLLLGSLHLGAATRADDDLRRVLLLALGARHVAQAAWLRRPTPARCRLARWVDATHGATAVAWAVSAPERRREGALSVASTAVALASERH